MLPFESVATATDSPRYSPAGSLRKFGTVVKGMSGTPVTVAFCWQSAEAAVTTTAAHVEGTRRFMGRSLYQAYEAFNPDRHMTLSRRSGDLENLAELVNS